MTKQHCKGLRPMMDAFDGGDPWGSAVAMGFAICEVSTAIELKEPATLLDYHAGPFAGHSLEVLANPGPDEDTDFVTTELANAVMTAEVGRDDLIFAARVLNRYLAVLEDAGRSY